MQFYFFNQKYLLDQTTMCTYIFCENVISIFSVYLAWLNDMPDIALL